MKSTLKTSHDASEMDGSLRFGRIKKKQQINPFIKPHTLGTFDGYNRLGSSYTSKSNTVGSKGDDARENSGASVHIPNENFDTIGGIDCEFNFSNAQESSSHDPSSPSDGDDNDDVSTNNKSQTNPKTIELQNSKMALLCTIPPKSGSRWSASFGGSYGLLNLHEQNPWSYSNTRFSLGYHLFSRAAVLCDWDTIDGRSQISYGTNLTSSVGTNTEAKVHYPTHIRSSPSFTIHTNKNVFSNTMNLDLRVGGKIIPHNDGSLLNTSDLCGFNHSSPIDLLSIGISNILPHTEGSTEDGPENYNGKSISTDPSSSTHTTPIPTTSGYLYRVNLNCGINQSPLFQFRFQIPNMLKLQQRVDISFDWGRGHKAQRTSNSTFLSQPWEMKTLITRQLSKFASFSVGLGHSTWSGLSWIIRLSRGDIYMNLPIRITGPLPVKMSWGEILTHYAAIAYMTFLTGIIDCVIDDLMSSSSSTKIKNLMDQEQLQKQETMLRIAKEKKDAEAQLSLMKRNASKSRRLEDAKNGLIIEYAWYGYATTPGRSQMDATHQLQFWVIDSKLELSGSSKSNMLGFYDIKLSSQLLEEDTIDTDKVEGSKTVSLSNMWKIFGLHTDNTTFKKSEENSPVLFVKYKFNGKVFQIVFEDEEAVSLPNPRAIEVPNL